LYISVFSLKAPESSNCESITGYDVRYPTNGSTPMQISSTSTSILTDGNVEITFSVRAKNNDDFYSDYETLVFTSDKLGEISLLIAVLLPSVNYA